MTNKNLGPNSNGPSQNQILNKSGVEALLQVAIASGLPEVKLAALQAINAADAMNGNHELGAWAVEQLVASLPEELHAFGTGGAKKKTLWNVPADTFEQYAAVAEAQQVPGFQLHHAASQAEFDQWQTAILGKPYQYWDAGKIALVNQQGANIVHVDFEQSGTVAAVMTVVALDYNPSEDGSSFVAEWNEWPWLPGEGFYEGK